MMPISTPLADHSFFDLPTDDSEFQLNDFATRSFRDTADQDYILARMAYRSRMYPQFLWSGLQAIEKYLKAILLYNRIPQPRRGLGHRLDRALELAKKLPFDMSLSAPSMEIIRHLDIYGRFRYLDVSYHVRDRELLKLDKAVWEIRLYCRVINHAARAASGQVIDMLPGYLTAIERAKEDPSYKLGIPSGVLEKILSKKDHPARPHLVWKNMFFNSHNRKTTQWRDQMHAVNAPLGLKPDLLEAVRKYVWLPNEVVVAYEEELKRRQSAKNS